MEAWSRRDVVEQLASVVGCERDVAGVEGHALEVPGGRGRDHGLTGFGDVIVGPLTPETHMGHQLAVVGHSHGRPERPVRRRARTAPGSYTQAAWYLSPSQRRTKR